jgi:hypothetical protein
MLTGPVYDSIQAECNWIDSIDRRDATAASKLLHASFSQVDAGGVVVHNRATLLANVVAGRFGKIELTDIKVPFSAGSTNVVISTWTFHERSAAALTGLIYTSASIDETHAIRSPPVLRFLALTPFRRASLQVSG